MADSEQNDWRDLMKNAGKEVKLLYGSNYKCVYNLFQYLYNNCISNVRWPRKVTDLERSNGSPPTGLPGSIHEQRRIQTISLGGTNFSSSGMYFGWTNEGEARTEGEAQDIAGRWVWGGGLVSPQKIFENSNLKLFILVHSWSKN